MTGTYTLYTRRNTGGAAVEAALAEAGAPFAAVDVPRYPSPGELAAFRAINPRGQVPVLVHPDGTVITESPAILTHIADSFPAAKLIPAPGSSGRAFHDRWMAFFQANVYEAFLREAYPDRYVVDPAHAPEVKAAAESYIGQHFEIFEQVLTDDGPYLLGNRFQVIDIYVWLLVWWSDRDWLARHCPKVHRLWQAAGARPALAEVAARHWSDAAVDPGANPGSGSGSGAA